ncbi:MAG: Ycf66 family protein [Spirulinaceae cyanobacterium]
MVNFGLYSTSVLAQVNIGGSSAVILGIVIAVSGALLYFLRSIRPELSRDHDIFFAAVGLLCGFILIFQGWRLDPILQFGQFLLTGSTIFFALETIRLRGVATEQARRNTPIVDDERPVSRVYRAELDELEPYEEEQENRRLRGYQDPRSNRRPPATATTSDYPRSSSRDSRDTSERDRYNSPSRDDYRERPPKRRPRTTPVENPYDDWGDEAESWQEKPTTPPQRPPRRPRPQRPPQETRSDDRADIRSDDLPRQPRKRRPRPSDVGYSPTLEEEAMPTEYVDYQPIDELDDIPKDKPKDRDESSDRQDSEVKDNLGNFDY